jgi:membrane protein
LFGQLRTLMGAEAASAIESLLASLSLPRHGLSATAIGAIVLVIGATSVFGELQDALDRIWRAPARVRAAGWWRLLRSRLLSFGMILGIAFLLMISLVLSAAISALGKWWGGFFGSWEPLLQVVNVLVGFALTTLVFAMIYKLMPRVAVRWHDVWLGALTTALLFTVGRFLIGLYIGKSGVASGFGAAGSIAIVFVWVYYSAQIFLLGAEFTWVYAQRFGSLRPAEAGVDVHAAPLAAADAHAQAGSQNEGHDHVDASQPAAASTITLPTRGAPVSAAVTTPVARPPAHTPKRAPGVLGLALAMTAAFGVRFVVHRIASRLHGHGMTHRVARRG